MEHSDKYRITTAHTAAGTSFAILPVHTQAPAPTLILLAMSAVDTLSAEPYCVVGRLLHNIGWNVASIDLPCHGGDQRPGEPPELKGWASRIAAGEEITADFQLRINDLTDHLTAIGISDPRRIGAAGTSRGGFMAFHAAASNPAIRAVAAFSPVIDLAALTEFAAISNHPLVEKLSLVLSAEAFTGRSAWIYIGSKDRRVGTEKAAAFALALAKAGCKTTFRRIPVTGHTSSASWHIDAAQWLQRVIEQ